MGRYGVGVALLLRACVTDSTKAERFVGLLQTKNYAGARGFFTVRLDHGDWLISNFACGLAKPAASSP